MVRRLRNLSSKKGRDEASLILLEGTNLLIEALRKKHLVKEIVATSSWIESHLEIVRSIDSETDLIEVTETVLKASLTTKNPDGVAALFPLIGLPKPLKQANFVLALDRIQDPGNLGTLFRTALAADVQLLWLALGADPLNQKTLRSSAGAVINIPYERFGCSEDDSINELVKKLKHAANEGSQIVGTIVPKKNSSNQILPYWMIDWIQPTVLVLGNEGAGLHPKLISCCTHLVTLPHSDLIESLNVASAAVPLLLERRRAKMSCVYRQIK